MTTAGGVEELAAAELALRLSVQLGTAAYAAYLVEPAELDEALSELRDEIASASNEEILMISPRSSEDLVVALANASSGVVVVDARTFSRVDWLLSDQRRSEIDHRGLLVFVTTRASFGELMRTAPNLASWLGGEVFAYPGDDEPRAAEHREQRLTALRSWAAKTDDEVVEAARAGTLPRDPEYAEWLVLLGHSELLDSHTR
jgi:hypothetical protein